jgi:hypothetical protein
MSNDSRYSLSSDNWFSFYASNECWLHLFLDDILFFLNLSFENFSLLSLHRFQLFFQDIDFLLFFFNNCFVNWPSGDYSSSNDSSDFSLLFNHFRVDFQAFASIDLSGVAVDFSFKNGLLGWVLLDLISPFSDVASTSSDVSSSIAFSTSDDSVSKNSLSDDSLLRLGSLNQLILLLLNLVIQFSGIFRANNSCFNNCSLDFFIDLLSLISNCVSFPVS